MTPRQWQVLGPTLRAEETLVTPGCCRRVCGCPYRSFLPSDSTFAWGPMLASARQGEWFQFFRSAAGGVPLSSPKEEPSQKRLLFHFQQRQRQLRDITGRHAGDASGLGQRPGTDLRQLFPGFQRQSGKRRIVKIGGDGHILVALDLPDDPLLPGNVARVADLGLDAQRHGGG